MHRTGSILVPASISLFLAALYLYTMPQGLTWAYDGADGGDLVTAAATGGVPHPTGYPTYLLAASAFLRIPIGSLAYRTNLLSATCSVLGALFVYLLVRSWEKGSFAAAVASLAFGTFPLVWSQAIITEVYALNAFFVALLLLVGTTGDTRRPRSLFVGGLIAGLALGNHLSILFMLPLLLISNWETTGSAGTAGAEGGAPHTGRGGLVWRGLGLLTGLLVYLAIPLRARAQAPVNWGNAANSEGFSWLVSGKAYWHRLGDFNLSYLWSGIQAWSHVLTQQLGVPGLLLVAFVLAVLFKRSWKYLAPSWLIIAYSALAILFYSPDSYVYLIPALLALSIWMGFGAGWIVTQASSRQPLLKPAAVLLILGYLTLRAVLMIPSVSLASDKRAEQYARTVLAAAPARAMIFTTGDEATFSIWYIHYAYHERPDVAVVSSDLLIQPWYRTILAYTYPGLILRENALLLDIIRDNPARPACQLGSDIQVAIRCPP